MTSAGRGSSGRPPTTCSRGTHGRAAMRNLTQNLCREFCTYYKKERAAWVAADPERDRWAPRNPRRLFNLAFKGLYRAYYRYVTLWEFLDCVYRTLGTA